MRCASKRPRFSCPVVGHRFFDEAAKFPRCRVGFNLTIPNLGVELSKPLPEPRKFPRGKALDEEFEFLDGAHDGPYGKTSNDCTPGMNCQLTILLGGRPR